VTFLYVDRIVEYVPGRLIRGVKNVTRSEPFLVPEADGRRRLREPILIEALAQLGSWLVMADAQFLRRPLFLGEDLVEVSGSAHAGDQVDLAVELKRCEDDVVETSGTAAIDGQVVVRSHAGRGSLMPMADFASPDETRTRFQGLHRPEFRGVSRVGGPRAETGSEFWRLSRHRPPELIDGVIEHQPGQAVAAFKNIAGTEAYFAEHFARRPVVPGVIMLTIACDACELLVRPEVQPLGDRRRLRLTKVVNGRFRKIVEPGDQCIVKAKVKRLVTGGDQGELTTTVAMYANDHRVAQVELEFAVAPLRTAV
jgi:3-hydroxyacyl-[acyl-carrier-protein] dehydratase